MDKITDLNVAIDLLTKHNALLFCYINFKDKIFYCYKDNMILIFNDNFKSYLSIEEFKRDYYLYQFYLYSYPDDNNEIEQNYTPIRQ